MSEPLVIVGNAMAAMRLVEELHQRALGRYAIAVIGEEPRPAYNRVLLSAVLAREVSRSEIELKPLRWWRDSGVTLIFGHAAVEIDRITRRVRLANGTKLPFSKLVLAPIHWSDETASCGRIGELVTPTVDAYSGQARGQGNASRHIARQLCLLRLCADAKALGFADRRLVVASCGRGWPWLSHRGG